jgi:hypothetical protein
MSTAIEDLEAIEYDIGLLSDLGSGVEKYGINKTSLYLLNKTALLSGSALSSLGLESITPETQTIALEAISAEAKEKSAKWSARIIEFFKDGSAMVTDRITELWDKVKEKADLLTSKTWDATKVAGSTIAAHPYKTIMIALAAAAATFGVVAFVGTSLPVGVVTNGQLQSFMLRLQTMYHRIKLPFGKITTTAVSDGRLIFATVDNGTTMPSTVVKSAADLGWTKVTTKAIFDQAGKVVDGAKKGIDILWRRVLKPGEKILATVLLAPRDFKDFVVNKTGMRTAGWISDQLVPALYYSLLYKLVHNLYQITKDIVVKTIQMIKDTFSSLTKVLA